MSRRLITSVAIAGFTAALTAASATCFAQADQFAMARAAAANQLGVMEYCQGRGDVGADAVTAQRAAMTGLPASSASTEGEEALGKQGTLSAPNGTRTTLDSLASGKGTTVSALCKQMGSAALQSAAAMHGGAGTMPGGVAMPAMPNGMAMPSMPAMPNGMSIPSMPSAPKQP